MLRLVFLLILLFASPGRARRPLHVAVVSSTDSLRDISHVVVERARSLLEEELGRSSSFVLVERQQVEDLLREIVFQQSGVTDTAGATDLGRQLNVDAIFFTQIHRIPSGYELSVKATDVPTGRIMRIERETLDLQARRMQQGVRRLARRLIACSSLFLPEDMVFLPPGRFLMGSDQGLPDENPPHYVSVQGFYLDRYEVRRIAFEDFLVRRGRKQHVDPERPDYPATMVTWSDAAEYCRSQGKRLPTEAEWEYAARGKDGRIYPWGNSLPTSSRACFQTRGPLSVDALAEGATPEGIYQLAGNVAEWVADWYDPTYYEISPPSNPPGPPNGDYRVVRGGSWAQSADALRASARAYHNPDRGADYIGFRCARDASPKP